MSAVLSDVAVTIRACDSPGPAEMPARSTTCDEAFSRIVGGSEITPSVGGALTKEKLTVSTGGFALSLESNCLAVNSTDSLISLNSQPNCDDGLSTQLCTSAAICALDQS